MAGSGGGDGLFERVEAIAASIRSHTKGFAPEVGIVLGSGLGGLADGLDGAMAVPYSELEGFPRSTVAGHKGRLVCGTAGGVKVMCLQGRFHLYEGYSAREITLPIRAICRLGVAAMVITNAAGGVSTSLKPGDLMLIADHLNLLGTNPLEGPNDERLGPRFPDMTTIYPQALREAARAAAPKGTPLAEGVYAALRGPSYETPAEIRMIRALGGDAVGMSTAPEAIVCRHMRVPVLGISGIANAAAGMQAGHVLTHQEVVETMDRIGTSFQALIRAALPGVLRAAKGLAR